MKTPEISNDSSDESERPRRRKALPSRIMEKAAREQLAGPFGKLGRYALKQHWGMTIPDLRENESNRSSTETKEMEGKTEKSRPKNKTLFRQLLAHLKRVFRE